MASEDPTPQELFLGHARMGNLDDMKTLAAADAALATTSDASGNTAVHVAAHNGFEEIVAWLLEQGADARAVNASTGDTALHGATWKGHLEVVKVLVAADATLVDVKNKAGKLPIDLAKSVPVGAYLQNAKLLATMGDEESSGEETDEEEED